MSSPHHAHVCATGSHGCWAVCQCQWTSPVMRTARGASYRWAEHFRAVTPTTPPTTEAGDDESGLR